MITFEDMLAKLRSLQLLDALLSDYTTGAHIRWGTNALAPLGAGYAPADEIKAEFLLPGLVLSRHKKRVDMQSERTKSFGEVFTPFSVCKTMTDHADEVWFGRPNVFDDPIAPIAFPEGKTWEAYVKEKRLEITCGEAPFLTTLYDSATGEEKPTHERVGFLDRKLRVVRENTRSIEERVEWALRACKAVYGYEIQGDSLLIARVNVLTAALEFCESSRLELNAPSLTVEEQQVEYGRFVDVIAKNLWQMDGLTGRVPYSRAPSLFDFDDAWNPYSGKILPAPCKIVDWRDNLKEKDVVGLFCRD